MRIDPKEAQNLQKGARNSFRFRDFRLGREMDKSQRCDPVLVGFGSDWGYMGMLQILDEVEFKCQ